MKIACLQFAPVLGDVEHNLSRADAILEGASPKDLDLIVLPELAFSGYNFRSLKHISPYLEPTTSGISSLWCRAKALKYDCTITVGYPEKVDIRDTWPADPEYYNSAVTVNQDGETIANYRKTHLYYTDETWALEGPRGFYGENVAGLGKVAMGICMDINPYKFESPWNAYEFSKHVVRIHANLVILSMAWLTREDAVSFSQHTQEPDMETLSYWIARFEPMIRTKSEEEIIIVVANRCGVEDDAVYAGTSAVLGVQNGEVAVYGVLGRGQEEVLVVDTSAEPIAKLFPPLLEAGEHDDIDDNLSMSEDEVDASPPMEDQRSEEEYHLSSNGRTSHLQTDPATFDLDHASTFEDQWQLSGGTSLPVVDDFASRASRRRNERAAASLPPSIISEFDDDDEIDDYEQEYTSFSTCIASGHSDEILSSVKDEKRDYEDVMKNSTQSHTSGPSRTNHVSKSLNPVNTDSVGNIENEIFWK